MLKNDIFPCDLKQQARNRFNSSIVCILTISSANIYYLHIALMQGETKLPSRIGMWEDIRRKQAAMSARYNRSMRHTIQVDYIGFMDELADIIGCKPDLRESADHFVLNCTCISSCTANPKLKTRIQAKVERLTTWKTSSQIYNTNM